MTNPLSVLAPILAAILLSGCAAAPGPPAPSPIGPSSRGIVSTYSGPKATAPVPDDVRRLMAEKGMARTAPILIRIFKEEKELEVWKLGREGRYLPLKSYAICNYSGTLGPKIRQGDRQAPEGFYSVYPRQMNPNSDYYLSFDVGFPNEFDRSNGRTGNALMVHGGCLSAGCYAMGDDQIREIYALARDALAGGQRAFQVQALPFRMTGANMLRHASNPNMPFWRTLKVGSDAFEETGREVAVSVRRRTYAFNLPQANPVTVAVPDDPRTLAALAPRRW